MKIEELKRISNNARINIIESIGAAKSGHTGGSLSVVDILTVLYFDKMNINPQNPKWKDRDRLVLSKGHAAPALYAVLAEKGYFPKENLTTLAGFGSMLQGHPDMKSTPGIDMSTGSLGQGLSVANGMALAAKLDNKDHRIYVILGDGEVQEGQIWEAAMSASHYKLDNLLAVLDFNGLQIGGSNEEVMNINPIDKKFLAFGWHTIKIDGHDLEAISAAIDEAKTVKEKPTVIIAKTVKGKGVSFMENDAEWHGTAPNEEQRKTAIEELERGEA
jgi:transketolase